MRASAKSKRIKEKRNPFPGMRSYSVEEAKHYSYDKELLQEGLTKLMDHQFLSLYGEYGSGKSSFVHCAIIPSLVRDRIPGKGGDTWDYFTIRPGTTPIWNLAYGLAHCAAFENSEKIDVDAVLTVEKRLSGNVSGLLELFEEQPLKRDCNLFIYVKNLEDLFVFKDSYKDHQEATQFLNLILQFLAKRSYPVYFCFSISSDIQREISLFPGLLEMINKGTILLPEVNREQFQHLFLEGTRKAKIEVEPDLMPEMLVDFDHGEPSNYEVQHTMKVMVDEWMSPSARGGTLGIRHYRKAGGFGQSLDHSAEYIYQLLKNKQKHICERVFRTIAQTGSNGRKRGVSIGELSHIAGCAPEEVIEVIEKFNYFHVYLIEQIETLDMEYRLTVFDELIDDPYSVLNEHSIVTISSHHLVSSWRRLNQWEQKEHNYATIYQQLVVAALAHGNFDENGHRRKGYLVDPELQQAREWYEKDRPTKVWAKRYSPHFEESVYYLQNSDRDFRARKKYEETRQKLSEKRKKIIFTGAIVLSGVFCIVGAFIAMLLIQEQQKSELLQIQSRRIDYIQNLDSLRVLYINTLQDVDSAQIDQMRAYAHKSKGKKLRMNSMVTFIDQLILKDSLCKRSIRQAIVALQKDLDSAKTSKDNLSLQLIEGRLEELKTHDFCKILHTQCAAQLDYFTAAERICELREESSFP